MGEEGKNRERLEIKERGEHGRQEKRAQTKWEERGGEETEVGQGGGESEKSRVK